MIIRMFFFLIIPLIFSKAFGQNDAETLLKSIQNKFDSISDLTTKITQSINGKENLKGKLYYKKENQLRFEFKNILIISDGETSWNYNEKQNKVIITDYKNEGNKILSIKQIIYEYPEDCELSTYEAEGRKVLQLIPDEDTFSFSSIKLFVDENNLITSAVIDDPATGIIRIELSDYQINKNLPDNYFSFSPPEGSQVIDLR